MSEDRNYEFKLSDGRQVVLRFDFKHESPSYSIFIDGKLEGKRPCGVGWSNEILELRVRGLYDPNPAEKYMADTRSLLTQKGNSPPPKKRYNRNSGDILSARMTVLLLKIAQGDSKDGMCLLSMKREMESIEATVQDMGTVTPELRKEFGKLKKAYSDNIYKF